MSAIDLKEIAARESEQVEWKENVADPDSIIKTIVAFSNDFSNLGGGYVVCGAKETRDVHGFSKMELPGLSASRFREIEGRVLQGCRDRVDPAIVPLVHELPAEQASTRVLVFVVPASPQAHLFRDQNTSAYYIRISRETREARNGLLRELLVRKKALEPWDRRPHPTATIEDIDALMLREYLQRMGLWDPSKSLEDYLSPDAQLAALALPMCVREPITGMVRPRNFALLLFGRQPSRFFPGAHVNFSVYSGKDRSEAYAERNVFEGTVVEQAQKLIASLNTQAYSIFDKATMGATPNLLKYPQRALQETVVNALAHRDYELPGPVRVTVFSDRIEIYSPGALPTAVDREKFVRGQATPVWRNQALAYFFNKLQLAQAEGQGIPTILRSMREEGCPPPRFDIGSESVLCVLPAHPRHELMQEHKEIERNIVIGNLDVAAQKIEALLAKDPYNYRTIELLCEVNKLFGTPERVFAFIEQQRLDLGKLNVPTQLVLADSLVAIKNPSNQLKEFLHLMLHSASNSHLQETEAKRLAFSLRWLGDHEEAIAVVNRTLLAYPTLRTNPGLMRIRAEARIDLAKRCMATAKNSKSTPRIKGKAWDQCRSYLDEAERDLRTGVEHAGSSQDREPLEKDLKFLEDFKRRVQKPQSGPRRR